MTTTQDQSRIVFDPWPQFEPEDFEAATRILASGKVNYWTGNEGTSFETEFASLVGVKHAIALCNGTVALDAAFEALGIGRGDEVILPPRTFVATGSSIVRSGATPIFADLDLRTGNLDPESVERAISPRTKAIVAVHLGGWPCDLQGLRGIAGANKLALIEDCAQAHGAAIDDRSVGSWGDVSAWSFCQDKIITTAGEGGMVTTNSDDLWNKMWSLKDHGKSYEAVHRTEHEPGFRWLHESFGTNWRLTEIQSAIGRNQLLRLPSWNEKRTANATHLLDAWESLDGLRTERTRPNERHAYYKFYVYLRPEALRSDYGRDRIVSEITQDGVPCFTGSCSEIYLEKAFQDAHLAPDPRLPNAKELGETSLMFLVHPTLSEEAIELTSSVVRMVMSRATR